MQTATVVGPPGEDIHTDEHGRIKVQFHWDRLGQRQEQRACFVRVVQPWAGQGWGAVVLPRVGMEVAVTFLDGDPDRPIVTGALYNGTHHPPYPLPDERTKSALRSQSTPGGGYNEVRFQDASGAEEIFVRARGDFTLDVRRRSPRSRRDPRRGHPEAACGVPRRGRGVLPRRVPATFANTQMMGLDLAFPDVCRTPTPAGPVPYPNLALGPMAVPAVYHVLFMGMPAHNLRTTVVLSNGDNAGLALGVVSGSVMGPSRHLTGAFTALVGGLPATRLTSLSLQNRTNCIGARLVPSQLKVMILSP